MDYLNESGTITLDGVEFDLPPSKKELRKWEYREWKESKSVFRELWLDSYQDIGNSTCRMSYCLWSKNGGCFTLDGKKLKGEDIDKARWIMEKINES